MLRFALTAVRRVWREDHALGIVWVGICAYTVLFSAISFLRYDAFSYTDFDFSIYIHECWKIAHGSVTSSIFNDTPVWGIYLELISFLVTPFCILFHYNPKSLLFLQSAILGLGALPVFLIARTKISSAGAKWLALAYLINPALWYTNLYEYYPVVFSTLIFLLMFYFMERNRLCVILANYKVFTLLLLLPAFIVMEIGEGVFLWRSGVLSQKLKAYKYFFTAICWQRIGQERSNISKYRKISDHEMLKKFTGSISNQDIDNSVLKYIANPVFNVYFDIVRFIIWW